MKVTYKINYCMIGGRLHVDAWDIYNQIINVLPDDNAVELRESFERAEKKFKKKEKKAHNIH
jgi:hypothetical protein